MKKGLTLIEVFVALLIISILAITVTGVFSGCGRRGHNKASENLKNYLSTMYPSSRFEIISSTCTGTDSDGDGYISCSALIENLKDKSLIRENLECASSILPFNEGCRVPKLGIKVPL